MQHKCSGIFNSIISQSAVNITGYCFTPRHAGNSNCSMLTNMDCGNQDMNVNVHELERKCIRTSGRHLANLVLNNMRADLQYL